jgi:hypothetical protein
VAATSTGDYTVVFLGTANGHLKKVCWSVRIWFLSVPQNISRHWGTTLLLRCVSSVCTIRMLHLFHQICTFALYRSHPWSASTQMRIEPMRLKCNLPSLKLFLPNPLTF